MDSSILYDRDFYAWAQEQAALLRAKDFSSIDIVNLIEEVECLAKRERRDIIERFEQVHFQLLKWRFKTGEQCNSWRLKINLDRERFHSIVAESPSVTPWLKAHIQNVYKTARVLVQIDAGVDGKHFPVDCPWTYEQMIDPDFWPDA